MNRNGFLALLLFLLLASPVAAEPRHGEFEVHDLSLWITDGAMPLANARASFPSAFPATVRSSRAQRSSVSQRERGPIGLLTFYGRPSDDLDVELQIKSGGFVGHWPPAEGKSKRLRWSSGKGVALVEKIEDDSVLLWVDEDNWIQQARATDALYVQRGARSERFLAYDAELKLSSPLRLQGGPDKYTIANVSDATLHDVLVARLTPEGVRVAWLDELPKTNVKPVAKAKPAKNAAPSADQSKRTVGLFGSGKKPAAGDKAAKPKQAPGKPAAAKAAKDAAGGKLFGLAVPKPAPDAPQDKAANKRPASGLFGVKGLPAPRATDAKTAPLVGGVEIVLSEPLPLGSDEAMAATTEQLAEHYQQAGLSKREIEVFLSQYAPLLFESENLIVACRLDPATFEADLGLSVFPVPTKVVRVPVLLVRNIDPQLPKQISDLIAQLGDADFEHREEAEKELTEFGPLAFDLLKKAINDKDMEIVIRAERILVNQGQKAAGRQGASDAAAAANKPAQAGKAAGLVKGILRLFGN